MSGSMFRTQDRTGRPNSEAVKMSFPSVMDEPFEQDRTAADGPVVSCRGGKDGQGSSIIGSAGCAGTSPLADLISGGLMNCKLTKNAGGGYQFNCKR